MATNAKIQKVNVNTVANYNEAHAFSIGMKKKTGTISQQAKALGGIGEESIEVTMGKGAERKKVAIKVVDFFASINAPYGGGRIVFGTINARWDAYLRDKEGTFMVCKDVIQRIKIGKQNYILYREVVDSKGERKMKAATIYQPAPVRETSWTTTLICDGLSQSAFIDEVKVRVEESKAAFEAMKTNDELYVHDALTDTYVKLSTIKK
ncbi:MAG: hypothetical protein IKH08_02210 [Prevotella sp.]|nr:hypothetical protein [Prevotella sp.]